MFLRNGGNWQPKEEPSSRTVNGATDDHEDDNDARSQSSGLSSVGDRMEESRADQPSVPPRETSSVPIKKEDEDTKAGVTDDAMDLT
jgi:hypothetical protein